MFYRFSLVRFVSFCDITFVFEPEISFFLFPNSVSWSVLIKISLFLLSEEYLLHKCIIYLRKELNNWLVFKLNHLIIDSTGNSKSNSNSHADSSVLYSARHTPHATRHTPHATRHTPHRWWIWLFFSRTVNERVSYLCACLALMHRNWSEKGMAGFLTVPSKGEFFNAYESNFPLNFMPEKRLKRCDRS